MPGRIVGSDQHIDQKGITGQIIGLPSRNSMLILKGLGLVELFFAIQID
jgi:hypothetical protein